MKKKNVVQDVIPPKKSIRNVELLYKSKISEKRPLKDLKLRDMKPPESVSTSSPSPSPRVQEDNFSYKYEYEQPRGRSKKILYVSVGLLILIFLFGVSIFFKSASIEVMPKNQKVDLSADFKALKNIPNNGLSFQTVTTAKDVEKTVSATNEEKVEKKATGTVVVYNNYGTQAQQLIKTTRLETPEGLIFRTTEDIVVPGIQTKDGKSVAGSVEVVVEADQSGPKYNVGLKDFTIVGFKGTAKYTKFYGRSKTEMSGGFSGMQKTVSKEIINQTDEELESLLKTSLVNEIISQIPENFVLYQNGLFYDMNPTGQVYVTKGEGGITDTVILRKKGSITAIIFDRGALSKAIVSKTLPDIADNVVKITNLNNLEFNFSSTTSFNPDTGNLLNFDLKGEVNFEWIFDENKLKSELLGMSKNNAVIILSTYDAIKEANIEIRPFWSKTIPEDSEKVTIVNLLEK